MVISEILFSGFLDVTIDSVGQDQIQDQDNSSNAFLHGTKYECLYVYTKNPK